MQYSVHAPSRYICTHWNNLLPSWSHPVCSVLVVLQPSSYNLLERNTATETEKQILRQTFLQFGYQVAKKLQQMGYLAELFDPRTGLPLLSKPGQKSLDDVAVARSCLGYPMTDRCGCSVILHPLWGSAVYPSTLMSSAEPALVERVVEEIAVKQQTSGGLRVAALAEGFSAFQSATSLVQAGAS